MIATSAKGISRQTVPTVPDRVLGVLLMNPPTGPGVRTRQQVQLASKILNCHSVRIANLNSTPTADFRELSITGADSAGWLDARAAISDTLAAADEVLVGWGRSALNGAARLHRRSQIAWTFGAMRESEATHYWSVGGQERHPSRWHQYVSDLRLPGTEGTMSTRLQRVLIQVPVPDAGLDSPGSPLP